MPSQITKTQRHKFKKDHYEEAMKPQPANPAKLVLVAGSASEVLRLTFDRSVKLEGVPAFTTDLPGLTATGAVLVAPNIVDVTFSGDISSATQLHVPYQDPAIRTSSGGYVVSPTFTFS